MRGFVQRHPVIVCFVRQGIRIRFIPYAPHHHTGVILIPGNHILQYLFMIFRQIPSVVFRCPHTYRRGFVYNHNPFPVAQLIHLFRIGVMTGPETVCMQPVIEVDIRHVQTLVNSSAVERTVLMLTGAVKPERSSVNQETGPFHPYFPDAEGQLIQIIAI